MHRTMRLKLETTGEQENVPFRTMDLYHRAFEASARWGFQNRNIN
ncbi:MAG: hypothetical protein SA339_14120 [Methanomassiliicoccus sp.]|nr:hypothetical protein [Methanomassiliicoccus sp.]